MRNYNDFSTGQVWPESIRLRRSEGYGSKPGGPWLVIASLVTAPDRPRHAAGHALAPLT